MSCAKNDHWVKKTENGQGAKMAHPPSAKAWDKGQDDISLQGLKPCRQWASHNYGIGWRETKIRKPLHLIGKTLGSCRFSCQRIPVNIETRRNISNQIDDTSKSMKQVFWYNEMFASACMLNTTNNNELNKSIAKSSRELVWNSEHLPTNRNICELPEHLSAHLKHIKQQASSIIIINFFFLKWIAHTWSRIWGHRWMRDIMWVPSNSLLCFSRTAQCTGQQKRTQQWQRIPMPHGCGFLWPEGSEL